MTDTLIADEPGGRNWVRVVGTFAARNPMVIVLILLIITSQLLYPGFLNIGNLRNILSQSAAVGIVAVGMTFVMISAGFDLSVGAIVALTATIFARCAGIMPIPLAALIALASGFALGTINGLVITRLRVNPFVATLGSASVFTGLAFLVANSAPIRVLDPAFGVLGNESFLGIPYSVLMLIAVIIIGAIVLAFSRYGYSLYAVGGNEIAARLSGLRVNRLRISTYVIVGVCAAVAGMLISSRVLVAQPDMGITIPLDAITIVIIGGTSLFGGEGAIWRTVVGLLILACLNNLFDSLALQSSLQSLVKGAILILAVAVDAFVRSRRAT